MLFYTGSLFGLISLTTFIYEKWKFYEQVYVLGRKMPDYSILPKISYMPQKNAVYTDLTVEENLRFFGQLQGLPYKSNYPVAQTVRGTVINQIQESFYNYLTEDQKKESSNHELTQVNYVYGEKAGLADYYAPGLIGFAVTLITSFLTLISMVQEERDEILEKILTFPVSPWEISLGYTLAFIIIGLLQALEVIVIAYFILGMMFMGSFVLLLLVIIIYIIGLQGLGTLLSTLAKNEFQAVQFTLLLIIPSVFLTGAFWPLESLYPVLRPLAWCIPLTYLNQALRSIMLRGWGLANIGLVSGVLALFAISMLSGSIWIMSRKRGHLV